MAQRDFTRLSRQLDEIDGWLAGGEEAVARRVDAISGWSVAQQVDHVLVVVEKSVERLMSRPEPLSRGLTWKGRLVLGLGWFPRGIARAPRGFEGREIACAGAGRPRPARAGRAAPLLRRPLRGAHAAQRRGPHRTPPGDRARHPAGLTHQARWAS